MNQQHMDESTKIGYFHPGWFTSENNNGFNYVKIETTEEKIIQFIRYFEEYKDINFGNNYKNQLEYFIFLPTFDTLIVCFNDHCLPAVRPSIENIFDCKLIRYEKDNLTKEIYQEIITIQDLMDTWTSLNIYLG